MVVWVDIHMYIDYLYLFMVVNHSNITSYFDVGDGDDGDDEKQQHGNQPLLGL